MKKSSVPLGLNGIYVGKGGGTTTTITSSTATTRTPLPTATISTSPLLTTSSTPERRISQNISPSRVTIPPAFAQNTQMTVRSTSPATSNPRKSLSPQRQSNLRSSPSAPAPPTHAVLISAPATHRPSTSPQRETRPPLKPAPASSPPPQSASSKSSPPPPSRSPQPSEKKLKLKEASVGKTLRSQKMEMRLKTATAERGSESTATHSISYSGHDDEVSHVASSTSGGGTSFTMEPSGRSKVYAPETNTYGGNGTISNRTKRIIEKQQKLEGISKTPSQKLAPPPQETVTEKEKEKGLELLSAIEEDDSETVTSAAPAKLDSSQAAPPHQSPPYFPPYGGGGGGGYPFPPPGYPQPGYGGYPPQLYSGYPPGPGYYQPPAYAPFPPQPNYYPYGPGPGGYGMYPQPMPPDGASQAGSQIWRGAEGGDSAQLHQHYSQSHCPVSPPHLDALVMAKQYMQLQQESPSSPASAAVASAPSLSGGAGDEAANTVMLFLAQLFKQQQQQQSSPSPRDEGGEGLGLQEQVRALQEQISLMQQEQLLQRERQEAAATAAIIRSNSSSSSHSSTPLITPQASKELSTEDAEAVAAGAASDTTTGGVVSSIIGELIEQSVSDVVERERQEKKARELETLDLNRQLLAQIQKLTEEVTTFKQSPPTPPSAQAPSLGIDLPSPTLPSPSSLSSLVPPFTPNSEKEYQQASREHKTRTGKDLPRVLYRLVPNRAKFKGAGELFDSEIDLVVELASALKAKAKGTSSSGGRGGSGVWGGDDERESYDHTVSFEYYESAKNCLYGEGYHEEEGGGTSSKLSRPQRGSKFSVENPLLQTQDDISVHSSSSLSNSFFPSSSVRPRRESKDDLELDTKSLLLSAACRRVRWNGGHRKAIAHPILSPPSTAV
jgi:hypothetical protein